MRAYHVFAYADLSDRIPEAVFDVLADDDAEALRLVNAQPAAMNYVKLMPLRHATLVLSPTDKEPRVIRFWPVRKKDILLARKGSGRSPSSKLSTSD